MSNVVVSTRIRLARNLQGYNFPAIIRGTEVESIISSQVDTLLSHFKGYKTYYMRDLTENEKASLIERYIISKNLANSFGGAVTISEDEQLSVMINEEDHIREQCLVKGFDFESAYSRILWLDKILSTNLRFAQNNGIYYTACPTNLGTGMRASLMVFLPAITQNNRLEYFSSLAYNKDITIRGAFGEGSLAEGYYYQISNSVTLGEPKAIINNVKKFASMVCQEEESLRKKEYLANPVAIKDRCLRALGILTHCAILDFQEFTELISQVKLGLGLDIISCDNNGAIDDLIVGARKHTLLLKNNGSDEKESERRAIFVKNALKQLSIHEV